MIKYIELKNTFRNRRFILFTIITPVMWYLFMISMSKSAGFFTQRYSSVWWVASCVMGIMGNSVITFGKTINNSQKFYFLQAKTSHYDIKNWMIDQMLIQLVLNLLIACTVTICAIGMQTINLNLNFLIEMIICQVIGLYLCLIGFVIGIVADSKLLETLSFPIMVFFALLIVPFNTWTTGTLVSIISAIQKFFPGYYLFKITQELTNGYNIFPALTQLFGTIILSGIPLVAFVWLHLRKKTN
ncbi:hypothetical protein GCM10025879_12220 [Leuconostoc litchii]|uniref:Lantibiotic ABC transporter permease n=1 Tax=Leuconostoc litchii TaxID=1981069 RepID=A0A6P2CMZ2_9LACO|nr:hypothetical protein [Leuconostoc litchii]TYC46264.1 hypothetical protein ESZ47_07250 [Leuconostoc litchii]GMA69976.1 hypothetical protein GCM10025879_12220 [Leuconostoc litchii]